MNWKPIFPKETSDSPTMERLALLDNRLFGIYLHRFPASPYRPIIAAHDHPWTFITVVLQGGYSEIRCEGFEEPRRKGHVAFRRFKSVHKIRLFQEGALTLCLRGPHRQQWSWRRLS